MTSGGSGGTNGRHRTIALAALALLLALAALRVWANVSSILTEEGDSAVPRDIWTLELTSLVGWLVVIAGLWWSLPHMLPPRRRWPVAVALVVLAAPIASVVHVGVMVGLREIVWALAGGDYNFPTGAKGWPYEMRKDIADYVMLVVSLGGLRWYLARDEAAPSLPADARVLEIVDGSRRIRVPHEEIALVEAAGNYVEVSSATGVFLHRATMAAIEAELGESFARIHRSRLVRKDMIRTVDTLSSGDFDVTLSSGEVLRGSRRYRGSLD